VETDEFLIKIDKMISSLRKIQTISLEKSTAEDVMRSIINELKTFNPKIKSYLKKKKIAVQIQTTNTKNNYVVFSQKLSKSLSKLINDFYSMNISKNKNEIEIHLKNLKNYNNRLLSFRDLKFNNPSGVKSKFIQILNNIKNEIIEIKKLLK
jgi:trehalose-6-phosphatase